MNDFTSELLAFAQKCSASKTPDAAFIATIINILAASNTEELIEIYEKIKDEE